MVITWSRFAGMKSQPVQPGQISPYDHMRKVNFVPEGGTVFHLAFVFLWVFLCKHVSLQNWKPIDCNWFKNCLLELVSICFHKIRSSRSEMFFKIGVLKCFAVFTGKHKCWCLFLIKFQTWKPAKRLQHRCFPVNTAKSEAATGGVLQKRCS